MEANRAWAALLEPLAELAIASSEADRTDIAWLHLPRGIVETTIVPEKAFWQAFRGDAGAMVNRQPPRSNESHYWRVVDYAFSGRLHQRLQQQIMDMPERTPWTAWSWPECSWPERHLAAAEVCISTRSQ